MSALLEVEDLAVVFDRPRGEDPFVAVDGLSYAVEPGRTVAIIGESGSGKSVAAQAVLGILETPPARVARGTVRFRGEDLLALGSRERRATIGPGLGMVFQDALAALNPVQRVGPQVVEGWRLRTGASRAQTRARAVELLDRVRIPDAAGCARAYPHELSGGMRQRAMIAMAIAQDPDLLIADEPTTALDATVQAEVMGLLRALQDESDMGLVLITHDLGVAAEVADELVVMEAGHVVESGPTWPLLRAPAQAYTRRLIDAVPRLDERLHPASPPAADLPVLEARGLCKSYAGRRAGWGRRDADVPAVDGVDLELRRGEVLGLVGESGSGKSTLASLLLLLEVPSAGSVRWWGQDAAGLDRAGRRRLRKRLQVVLQDPYASLDPRMSVADAIGEAFAIHPDLCARAQRRDRVDALLTQVGLDGGHAGRYPHELSGGQRQRVVIARALAVEPEVLVCDEPVSALDVSVQAQVLRLLDDLRRDLGLAYVFISHDLAVVRQLADRVAVMHRGRIVETADADTLYTSPQDPYTRALLAAAPSLAV